MTISNLNTNEYSSFYSGYIEKAQDIELIAGLRKSGEDTLAFFKSIPTDKYEYVYEANKWTIKELFLHLMDSERVFTYRALRFARKDNTSLPGFDEGHYTAFGKANDYSMDSLLKSYAILRQSTRDLFENFSNDMLLEIGEASGAKMSVRALGLVIIGHERHHCEVIRARYLN